MNQAFVAKTFYGLENVLADELRALGATDIDKQNRAVAFRGDQRLLYKANWMLRSALRIIQPLAQFTVKGQEDLYAGARKIPWHEIMSHDNTFAIDPVVRSTHFRHTQFPAYKTKDAIVDCFRDHVGKRPDVDLDFPDFYINVHIREEDCIISLDSSGDSLHKRGYRVRTNEAPINEALAAGLILKTGWNKEQPFLDPMCGSGTILAEACAMATNSTPFRNRKFFAFKNWKDFDAKVWEEVQEEALDNSHPLTAEIAGSDISNRAIKSAEANLFSAGFEGKVKLKDAAFKKIKPPFPDGMILTNPPYDERIHLDDAIQFYKDIGDKLKTDFTGYDTWIFSSNIPAMKSIGLRPSTKYKLYNGGLEARLAHYHIVEGSPE